MNNQFFLNNGGTINDYNNPLNLSSDTVIDLSDSSVLDSISQLKLSDPYEREKFNNNYTNTTLINFTGTDMKEGTV